MSNGLGGMISGNSSVTGLLWLASIVGIGVCLDGSLQAEVPLTTLRAQTRQWLRHEATLDDPATRDAAITALCDLYVVLRNDDRYATSEMLRGDAAKLRRRLLSIAKRRENQLRRQNIEKPANLIPTVDAAIAAAIARHASPGDAVGDGPSVTGGGDTAGGAAGGAGLPDTGWQLVELIQRVVSPDFWDSRGGPGTIRYFAMRRVLVVRATSDVHEQIKDLLTALR